MSSRRVSILQLSAMIGLLTVAASTAGAQSARALGEFTHDADVGRSTKHGSATYDTKTGAFTIAGSGINIWAQRDAFHYVWRPMTGDFIVTARGNLLGTGVEQHRKFGWMIRSTLDSASPHVSAAMHGDGLTSLQFRKTAGAITEEVRSPLTNVDVIQLERRGTTFIMSVAKYGDTLSTVEKTDIALGDSVMVGLFVCAHNDTVVERARFTDVRITVPAKPDFVPYRDYIGGRVEIMEVATGNRRVVYNSDGAIQAPNWTRDGKALIYNLRGRLYRFDLKSNTPTEINTAFATNNNNDHVISFDGKMLAISHQDPKNGGKSMVYTVPITGGTPKQITQFGPSYLHGWSPDGKTLVFTGIRNDSTDIYKIPSSGGTEVRLTRVAMNDGPEWARDGHIYFNSTRTGHMQLFRMNADGSEPTQLTSDPFNNWFPHVSPDGKSIVFISFPLTVTPTDHPWYKHVYIRQIPVGGGAPKVLAYVYGGQGTINVPSWSPDGKFVAFVSNTDKY